MSKILEVASEEEFNTHVTTLDPTTLLVLSFHTPWAAPCAQMNTVLATLAASYPATTPPRTLWLSVNAEELPDVSDAYDVTAVPFLVLARAGATLETVSGSDAGKVRAAIERHAAGGEGKAEDVVIPPKQDVTYRDTTGPAPRADEASVAGEEKDANANGTAVASGEGKEDLNKRLGELVKAAPVMLFMKGTPSAPQCGFSRQLVALLRENSVRYGFFNILADDEVRQGLKEFADWPTFPQLWVGGELVGGLDIVSLPEMRPPLGVTLESANGVIQIKEEIANDPDFLKEYAVVKA
jgi:Grx4 family monothiol glutaredoxin